MAATAPPAKRTRRAVKVAASKSSKTPSAAHYVGYVEDQEPIEAIMAKFAAMDEYMQTLGDVGRETPAMATERSESVMESERPDSTMPMMTTEQLEEVYRITAMQPVQMLASSLIWDTGDDEFDDFKVQRLLKMEEDDEGLVFLGEDLNDEMLDREFGARKRKRSAKGGPREPKLKKQKPLKVPKPKKESTFQDGFGRNFVFKKRDKTIDPRAQSMTKLPPKLDTWGHLVEPYVEPGTSPVPPGSHVIRADILQRMQHGELRELSFGRQFIGIVMDPPLRLDSAPASAGTVSISQFRALNLSAELMPAGLLFIWLEKMFTPHVLGIAEGWGLKYVENLAWVKIDKNNAFRADSSPFFKRSKLVLMIFKRDGEIDLRHQRNADVIFDFVAPASGGVGGVAKPEFVYTTIETLLPRAAYDPADPVAQPGKLLELWSSTDTPRSGWTKVVDSRGGL